jgi:small subunit ribosomal protein S13
MARIAGIKLPDNKRAEIGLTAIFGIGRNNALELLKEAKVDPAKKVADLTAKEVVRLTKLIDKVPVEGDLRKQVGENIKRLKVIGTYRGIRHGKGLPVRGQRTRVNARTKRGKRKTIGAMKKDDRTRLEGVKGKEGEKEGKKEKGKEK